MFGFSIFRLVFDLLFGWLFGHDRSNGFHIFNFNSYVCFFLTVLVVVGGSLLIKSYGSYQPARAFIPVSERSKAVVSSVASSHHHKVTQSAQHTHHTQHAHLAQQTHHTGKSHLSHSQTGHSYTSAAKAHKPLPPHAKATN
jgi:hypothetical protein